MRDKYDIIYSVIDRAIDECEYRIDVKKSNMLTHDQADYLKTIVSDALDYFEEQELDNQ